MTPPRLRTDWCNFFNFQTAHRHGYVVLGNMVRRGFDRRVVQNILRKASGQKARHVVGIMRVCARFTTFYRNAALGVGARHVGREAQVTQFLSHGAFIRRRVAWTCGEDLERACPVEGQLCFEYLGIRINIGLGSLLGALADGSRRVTDGIIRSLVKCVRKF